MKHEYRSAYEALIEKEIERNIFNGASADEVICEMREWINKYLDFNEIRFEYAEVVHGWLDAGLLKKIKKPNLYLVESGENNGKS